MSANHEQAHLRNMLQAAAEAKALFAGVTHSEVAADPMKGLALERLASRIADHGHALPEEFRGAHPELPWALIEALRDILAKDYGMVDHAGLHRALIAEANALIDALRSLVPE